MNLYSIGVAIFLVLLSGTAKAQIKIDRSVQSDQRSILQNDLARFQSLVLHPRNESLRQLMGTRETSGNALMQWLEDRVQYVVSESFDLNDNLFTEEYFYDFPNPGIFPTIERSSITPTGPSVIIMSNLGVGIYLGNKKTQRLRGVKLQGGAEELLVTSPRAGLIQVGPGLFGQKRTVNPQTPASLANSLVRLATFFHEARHSDGNGRSTGFLHAVCPEGHDMAGYHACDRNLNGPYKIGAMMLKTMSESCAECTVAEQEAMRVIYTDSFGRLIGRSGDGTPSTRWDARPEGRRR